MAKLCSNWCRHCLAGIREANRNGRWDERADKAMNNKEVQD